MAEPEPIHRRPWPSTPLDDDDLLSEVLRRLVAAVDPPDRVPDARFRKLCGRGHRRWRFLDCRHGRALLLGNRFSAAVPSPREALVWDPMTGARHRSPLPPDAGDVQHGAVLCACGQARDCRSSPFQVVLVWWKQEAQCRRAVAAVYSSQSGAWSQVVSAQFASTNLVAGDAGKPGVLVGDAIYWLLPESRILEFDAVRCSLALISVPVRSAGSLYWQCQLVLTEGGGLGLAMAKKVLTEGGGPGLSMATEVSILVWKRDMSPAATVGWSLHKSVRLDRCLPLRTRMQGARPSLLGFHEGSNMIFVWIDAGVFMVQLESMQSRMVCQGVSNFEIYPFAGFYTADCGGAQAIDAPELLSWEEMEGLLVSGLMMWHYADPRGDVHGPFTMVMLQRWMEHGVFDESFRVWRTDQTKEQAVLLADGCYPVV